jgi:hypothetical protein
MPQTAFGILVILVLLLFGGIGLSVLMRPSQYIRRVRNPWMEDTPWVRLQLRAVGLVVCLFVLMVFSGALGGNTKSGLTEGFHKNLLIALWLVFIAVWVAGITSLILWRIMAFRIFLRTHFDSEKLESPAWEKQMTILFCSLFVSIVLIAYVLAA